ncbi:MAG: alpha/beta hydrolase [Nitrosomonas sp.]|nr:alpha/beta hydrolase [Nitrosomonas sp.]
MNQHIIQEFFVEGPAGKLESILAEPQSSPKGIAIIAHPHPQHGGTMHNKIVHTLFNSLVEIGFITVKFNFRGVGKSDGIFDNGIGEIEDVVTLTNVIRDQFDNQISSLPILLAGFSFGGGIQLHAAKQLNPEYLILIAPSVKKMHAPPVQEQVKHTLIIHGENDEIVPIKTIFDWAAPQSLPVIIIPSAEHFFHGKLAILKQTIINFCIGKYLAQ